MNLVLVFMVCQCNMYVIPKSICRKGLGYKTLSVNEPNELLMSLADARAVEGPALFVDEPSEQSKSVADARAVEGPYDYPLAVFASQQTRRPAPSCIDVKQSKSVADASAVESPALSVDEPSEQSRSVADARAVEGLCFYRLACFRFAAGKAASPVVHDVKQSIHTRCVPIHTRCVPDRERPR